MEKTVKIKKLEGQNFVEIEETKTEVFITKEIVSLLDMQKKRAALIARRAMDQKSFNNALALIDDEISSIDDVIKQSKDLGIIEDKQEPQKNGGES